MLSAPAPIIICLMFYRIGAIHESPLKYSVKHIFGTSREPSWLARISLQLAFAHGQRINRLPRPHYALRTSSRFCLRQNHSGATLTANGTMWASYPTRGGYREGAALLPIDNMRVTLSCRFENAQHFLEVIVTRIPSTRWGLGESPRYTRKDRLVFRLSDEPLWRYAYPQDFLLLLVSKVTTLLAFHKVYFTIKRFKPPLLPGLSVLQWRRSGCCPLRRWHLRGLLSLRF